MEIPTICSTRRSTSGSDRWEIPWRIGITDYAQDQLGDVVYVELLPSGKRWPRTTCWSRWRAPSRWGRSTPVSRQDHRRQREHLAEPELVNQSPMRMAGVD